MIRWLGRLAQSFLMSVDPERAHDLAIQVLRSGFYPRYRIPRDERLCISALGLDFANPLGMAAGFDKSAEVFDELSRFGFGFVEVGTLTPCPQGGNPKPRVFRLPSDGAVINRYGFNNDGHAAALERLKARRSGGILGVNVGANKDAQDRIADYVAGVETFAEMADYLTVNVSSPNTPGLRDLQGDREMEALLARVAETRAAMADRLGHSTPVLLKIAPDLDVEAPERIAEAVLRHGFDGLIVSNTTVSRDGLADNATAKETGGLSGRSLFDRSTALLGRMRVLVGPDLPLIGVGGVDSAATAYEKMRAGATLVQLYTGLVYGGFDLVSAMLHELAAITRREQLATIGDATGQDAEAWAARWQEVYT